MDLILDADGNDGDTDAYDPWSMGLLCEDGSPPVKDDATDAVGKCPTNAPTSQPTAAPMPEDGDVCNTDSYDTIVPMKYYMYSYHGMTL